MNRYEVTNTAMISPKRITMVCCIGDTTQFNKMLLAKFMLLAPIPKPFLHATAHNLLVELVSTSSSEWSISFRPLARSRQNEPRNQLLQFCSRTFERPPARKKNVVKR